PDVVQRAAVVVETEEQGADERAGTLLVPAEAGDDGVRAAHVLHLDHGALAGLIGGALVLGDDAVETGALEAPKPLLRHRASPIAGRDVDGAAGAPESPLELPAPVRLRTRAQVAGAVREQVERDERRGRLRGELLHARRGRMETQLERVEVEPARRRDHDLTVDDAAGGQVRP